MSNKIFEAYVVSLHGLIKEFQQGSTSFLIPSYQRTYDWDKQNINELIEKCLAGFKNLSEGKKGSAPSDTFLGTVIVAANSNHNSPTSNFYEVVDGQQRLTTLILIVCALINKLQESKASMEENPDQAYKRWIIKQAEDMMEYLIGFVRGYNPEDSSKAPFLRIIREEDNDSTAQRQTNSALSTFFTKVYESYGRGNSIDNLLPEVKESGSNKRLLENYQHIKDRVLNLSGKSEEINLQNAKREFIVNALKTNGEDAETIVNECVNNEESSSALRALLFSSYIAKHVILVMTKSTEYYYAFDMFDSLNTTGELLTALDTLRPLVAKLEEARKKGGYNKSKSKKYLDNVKKCLEDNQSEQDKRQNEIKEFVISLAVYLEGKRISKDLNVQRKHLRDISNRLSNNHQEHENFVKSISDFSEFRYLYWSNLETQAQKEEEVATYMEFIMQMNTTLCLPIIARYQQSSKRTDFIAAAKALAAFLAIRRAYTRRTDNIDQIFRQMMFKKPNTNPDLNPLCDGLENKNKIWSVSDFKKELRYYLKKKLNPGVDLEELKDNPINTEDKDRWVAEVSTQPLGYGSSKALCRFLILVAANKAIVTKEGLWESGSIELEKEYINYKSLSAQKYKTIEHIAPQNPPKNKWPAGIYEDIDTKHTLGNLILLPLEDNIEVSNLDWSSKKKYYKALSSKTELELRKLEITDEKIDHISTQGTMHLLEFTQKINHWNLKIIQNRSKNIANRTWDTLITWL